MKVAYTITPKLRIKLKEPFGRLIEGTVNDTMAKLKEFIVDENPPVVISVGDVVSRNLNAYGINPQIAVIDNISLRSQIELPPIAHGEIRVHVKNPQGTLTEEAIKAIKDAVAEKGSTLIVVDGEEDLLVIAAVLFAPQKAFVVYGQPRCGIVVVKVTSKKKAEVKGFLNDMKPTKS